MRHALIHSLLALTLGLACDTNVDSSYEGKPLISLSGEVLPATPSIGGVEVVLAWQRFATDGDYLAADAVTVDGDFPATFDLDVYVPPADAALNHFDAKDGGVALGVILAVPVGTDLDTLDAETLDGGTLIGVVERHVLAYAPADISADSALGVFLGGAMTTGFHLMERTPASPAELAEYEACAEDGGDCEYPFDRLSPASSETALKLKLGGSLDVPNFT